MPLDPRGRHRRPDRLNKIVLAAATAVIVLAVALILAIVLTA